MWRARIGPTPVGDKQRVAGSVDRSGQEESAMGVCVFDVNEILLDLRALDPRFEARSAWQACASSGSASCFSPRS